MSLPVYFLRTALRSLRRGGQRVIVALLCIAFGVMSVVSMTLLSDAIESMMVVSAEELIGADMTMDRVVEEVILPEHIAELEQMKREGEIREYTSIAYLTTLTYRLEGSGEMRFPAAGMGIDPSVYPLLGKFQVSSPASAGIGVLIQKPGDLLVTKDIADQEGLRLGDRLILSNLSAGTVVKGTVQGIISDTPNHQGSKIYYSYETAQLLGGSSRVLNTVVLTLNDPEAMAPRFETLGWRPFIAKWLAAADQQVQQMLELMLKGAGILGMLVGGIGIANTMQVLLRRRRREIAVLKTTGYRQGHLLWMFAVEAGMLGIAGSLIGAAAGVAVSLGLVGLFSRTTNLLIQWVVSPQPIFSGLLIGFVTTITFAMFAILAASQVRPLSLLRSEGVDASRIPWGQAFLTALLCGAPFFLVTALVMGSAIKGAGVLALALLGLTSLGGLMRALAWLTTRLLPVRRWPLAHMARNNLRRRSGSLVFAMIALFVGVVSLAAGVVVTTSAQRAMDERLVEFSGSNITIIAPAAQEGTVRQAVETRRGVEGFSAGYQTAVRSITIPGKEDGNVYPLLIARSDIEGYTVTGAPWGSAEEGVYLNENWGASKGDTITIITLNGQEIRVPVSGSFRPNEPGASLQPYDGVLLSEALSRKFAPPETVQFLVKTSKEQVKEVSASLGKALPENVVINLVAYAARFTQAYQNLFLFAVAMAGLALLAGILLVANSVSLAMLDRRYEIGVMRAMGYAHRQVLFTLVVEYSLVAVIATGAGLLLIKGLLWVLSIIDRLAGSLLVLTPQAVLAIAAISIGLTLLTVLWVTWKPANVSPSVVLNDRE